MQRSSSRSKWKDVLGFDDGSDPSTPPTYRYTPASSQPSLIGNYPLFPRNITFSHQKNDILIRPSLPVPKYGVGDRDTKRLPDPPPLFYITLQQEPSPDIQTSRPDIVLHSGPSKSSRILSFAKFHTVTQSTDITLCPLIPLPSSPGTGSGTSPLDSRFTKPGLVLGKDDSSRPKFRIVKVSPTSGIFRADRFSFHCVVEGRGRSERFEWKQSPGVVVRCWDEDSESSAMKLVRSRTGETVAIFAREEGREAENVLGLFRFFEEEEGELGGELEVLAVMSLLSVVERGRRRGMKGMSNVSVED